ncbi:Histone-lysine N-methyltransferase ATXR6 [Glycine soja]|uniref:Histone-lysine N-methyltransferase ATXR6 n=1 Tax=Glycine soja TaxID=3848 RepID=A0A0B2R8P2_GLYSO|nr:Histone-lysine N-methyltransferase ATXR6 [Glycine soja]
MASSLGRKRTHAPKGSSALNDDVSCEVCSGGHSPSKLILCDKCDRGYHLFCLRPILPYVPKGSWFCPSCSNHKPKSFPLVQTKIIDFFRIQRSPEALSNQDFFV